MKRYLSTVYIRIRLTHTSFYDSIAIINETDYGKDSSGLPMWFNINYDDVDGSSMYQTFELKCLMMCSIIL